MTAVMVRQMMELLLLLVVVSEAVARETRQTMFGCEGETLRLSCPPAATIRVVRANYGRFSISVCNVKECFN